MATSDTPKPAPSQDSTFNLAYVLDAETEEIKRRFPEEPSAGENPDRFAVCFSGGGIRSACVALGVTQSLARHDLLRRVDYISAISGGGYFLGCLTAWIKRSAKSSREPGGFDEVDRQLAAASMNAKPKPHPASLLGKSNYARFLEPDVIRHLRRYSSYLTPRLGLLGGDSLAMISIYLRNLLLNLAMVLSGLFAIMLPLQLFAPQRIWHGPPPGWAIVCLLIAIVACFSASVRLVEKEIENIRNKGGAGSLDRSMLAVGIGLFGCCVLWYVTPGFYAYYYSRPTMLGIAVLLAVVGFIFTWFCFTDKSAKQSKDDSRKKVKAVSSVTPSILAIAWVCATVLVAGLSLLFFQRIENVDLIDVNGRYVILGLPTILASFPLVSYLFIGILGDQLPDAEREWLARFAGYFLAVALVAPIFIAIAIEGPAWMNWLVCAIRAWGWKGFAAALLPSGWIYITLTGVLKGRSGDINGKESSYSYTGVVIAVAPSVFLAGLLVLVSWGANALAISSGAAVTDLISVSAPTALLPADTSAISTPSTKPLAALDTYTLPKLRVPPCCAQPCPDKASDSCELKHQVWEYYSRLENPVFKPIVRAFTFLLEWWLKHGGKEIAAPIPSIISAPSHGNPASYLALVVAFAAFTCLLGTRLDANEFSMHLFYRNRLVRAFAGASNTDRKPNVFTGFDWDDDLPLRDLVYSSQTTTSETTDTDFGNPYDGPYPLWGTTLNITRDEDLSMQERKGASFIYSPLFCGWDYVASDMSGTPPVEMDKPAFSPPESSDPVYGYRRTSVYSGKGGRPLIGTAMAASGAAVSPNMGYHTRAGVAALLALFNVRLGWWTGNPRNRTTWCQYAPGAGYLLNELMGSINAEAKYVYLSDGGHFENLGLYELVRRRVRFVLAVDGDADKDYDFCDLGNAIEHCRRDFGVEIDISAASDMAPIDKEDVIFRKKHYAVGTITYPPLNPGGEPVEGVLLYIKNSLTGKEPADVLAMRADYKSFPHDSTANQFFNESLFESYRALGQHMMDTALRDSGIKFTEGPPDKNVGILFQKLKPTL